MEPSRPLRADAVRNRKKILDAAREEITRLGPDVPMDTIAEAAGVAVGTLYRHFPTKTDLVTAVIGEHSELLAHAIEESAERVAGGADAMSEISTLASDIVEAAAANRAVKVAAHNFGAEFATPDQESRARVAMTRLIKAAQRDGRLRDDLTADDFYLLLVTAPTDVEPPVRARWLKLFLAGFAADRD
ncbi:MAG TPA: helix-turn-helix domain-containing protein [Amycolatopsis sp.]|jgi:AcrR family transcriptional regulator|nr:helix-turn-helix domain-containing protein [Amycolatopsis sp.]